MAGFLRAPTGRMEVQVNLRGSPFARHCLLVWAHLKWWLIAIGICFVLSIDYMPGGVK